MRIKCLAFDCFGTLFDMSTFPGALVQDYVRHVRQAHFMPYEFSEEWRHLKAFDDVGRGFHELRGGGFKLVALSNGDPPLIEHLSKANGFAFHHVIDLCKHGVYKPDFAAYQTVRKDFGYWPQETAMVTANPTFGDIAGSFAAGMLPLVIRQPGWPAGVDRLADWLATRDLLSR